MHYVKFSYNAGDLITVLAGLRQLYENTGEKIKLFQVLDLPAFYYEGAEHPTKNIEGQQVCCNRDMFERLKPLIEEQVYIESFEIWKGEQCSINLNKTRFDKLVPMPYGDIYSWVDTVFPQLTTDLSRRWISISKCHPSSESFARKIIINRTLRYQNSYISYYFLKGYEEDILFSGTENEYIDFCNKWGLQIEYLKTKNFLELAQIIAVSKFMICNQSFHFHLAQAMKKPRILELSAEFPNTFIHGANGAQFYHQEALESHFKKFNQ